MIDQIKIQRELRLSDPNHPSHKFPDSLLEDSINKAISHCNKRVSVMDVLIEVIGGKCMYGMSYWKILSRRDRQYLTSKIGKMLNEKYIKESEKIWIVKEGVRA